MTIAQPSSVDLFIHRWHASSATECANYQLFLSELCDILHVPRPSPALADDSLNTYIFEKPVTFHHPDSSTSLGRIDLYKQSSFVLEAKPDTETTTPSVIEMNCLRAPSIRWLARGSSAVPASPQRVFSTNVQQE